MKFPPALPRPGPRRLAAALAAGLAVLCGLRALTPDPPPSRAIWVAAHDLPGGTPLHSADLVVRRLPLALLPRGSLPADIPVTGRLVAAPMREGEPMTDVRLLEPALLAALGPPARVAVPVRMADGAAAAAVARVGDRVDVLAAEAVASDGAEAANAGGSGGTATTAHVVASGLTVLAVPARAATADDGGGLVVVAATAVQAARLAAAATTARLSLVLVHR